MTYRFIFTAQFDRDLKLLRKHNSSLRDDFESFMGTFDAEAHPVIPGTRGARKARMPAKGRGKRGGYRVIYQIYPANAAGACPDGSSLAHRIEGTATGA